MKELSELAAEHRANRLADFASFVRLLAINENSASNALGMAPKQRASQKVIDALQERAAVGAAGANAAGSWAEQTTAQRLLLGAFTNSLKARSAWGAMQDLIYRVPLEVVLGSVITTVANAVTVAPGQPIPVRRLDALQTPVARRKVGSIVVLTNEFMKQSPSEAEAVISRELTYAVSRQIDVEVVATLLAASPPLTMTATSNLANDVATMFTLVAPMPDSRLCFLAAPDVAARLSASQLNYVRAFPDVTWSGGSLLGAPIFVSAGVPTGTLILVDCSRIAGALADAEVDVSSQASIEMLDVGLQQSAGTSSPATPAGAAMVNTFQSF